MSAPNRSNRPSGDGDLRLAIFALVFALLSLAVALICHAQPHAQSQCLIQSHAQALSGPARVIDGDTLEVAGQRVRLYGIDAPELRQTCKRGFPWHRWASGETWTCGISARRRLEELIDRRPVTCRAMDKDRYNRVIARCFVGSPHIDLGGWMVRYGHAVAYVRYSRDYLPQESVARGARLGLWAGTFVQPWEWRKGVR